MYGKKLRMARLMHAPSKKICIVPMDHGTTFGPINGIADYMDTAIKVIAGGADALILHKGLLRHVGDCPEFVKGKYILHLSASTALSPDPNYKVLVSSVEEAIKLGADGVSIHVNLGNTNEIDMIKNLGKIAGICMDWSMPLLAMIYTYKSPKEPYHIVHAARLAEELGADIVKIDYPGTVESMRKIVESVKIPVVIAGGVKIDSSENLLLMINDAIISGASGVAIGRNIFQYNNPESITNIISKLVHGELQFHECLNMLRIQQEVEA